MKLGKKYSKVLNIEDSPGEDEKEEAKKAREQQREQLQALAGKWSCEVLLLGA